MFVSTDKNLFQSLLSQPEQSQVSQPLVRPIPPASACYPATSPSGNCSEVTANWNDGNWRANQTGALQSPNFETFIFPNNTISACYLNTTLGFPCTQGSIHIIGVDARTPEDIQAAVRFAAAHNLRLVVKNTGYVSTYIDIIQCLTIEQTRLSWSKCGPWFVYGVDTQYEEYHLHRLICS